MSKIVQAAMRSKRSTVLPWFLLATLAVWGCGGGDQGSGNRDQADGNLASSSETVADQAPADAAVSETVHPKYEIHSPAFLSWLNTVHHLQARQTVRSDEYERIFALPAYRMTYGDQGGADFNPIILRKVMEYVFAPDLNVSDRAPKKKRFVTNYQYINGRLDAAINLADTLNTLGTFSRALARAYPFIPEFRRPETLHIHLTASSPQMTWFPPDALILDVGLALAAGPSQLEDMIAATLIRSLAPPASPLPHEAESGREALRSTFRKLHHEGIVNIIEKYPTLRLDVAHPTYQTPDVNRPRALQQAVLVLNRMGLMLETLLDPDSDTLETTGSSVDDLMRIGRQYEPTGYAMNRLIINRLGPDRFQEAAVSGPVAWLSAYQEAALQGDARGELADMPPFGEVVFTRLLDLMNR